MLSLKKIPRTLIIAEAGVNHNGSLKKCFQLVDAAKKAGAHIVKFQTFEADSLATKKSPKAAYQKVNDNNKNQYEMLKKLQLSKDNHYKIKKYCKKKKIEFLSSGFDIEDLVFLKKLKVKRFKVPSGEITNYLYLKKIASFKKQIILSTGMSTMKEVTRAIEILKKNGLKRNKISILHCSTEYPADLKKLNLKAIKSLKKKFKLNIGYSDHSKSTLIPSVAVALGASIIEKHITLNNNLPGPDHQSSLNPNDFRIMVSNIIKTEMSFGNGVKKPNVNEKKNIRIVRKSIVAKKSIKKGEKLSLLNLSFKRPGTGISPMKLNKILGRKSSHNFKKDDFIKV